jgi:hypothetical protein
LEVYQKTLEASVLLVKRINESWERVFRDHKKKNKVRATTDVEPEQPHTLIVKSLLNCSLGIPHLLAEAHSIRFADHNAAACPDPPQFLRQHVEVVKPRKDWTRDPHPHSSLSA